MPPRLGEHTEEVLREAGAVIREPRATKAVAATAIDQRL
jgi:hypothetical protein